MPHLRKTRPLKSYVLQCAFLRCPFGENADIDGLLSHSFTPRRLTVLPERGNRFILPPALVRPAPRNPALSAVGAPACRVNSCGFSAQTASGHSLDDAPKADTPGR